MRIVIAIAAILGASCAPSHKPESSEPWGAEAVAFFDERAAAICANDRYDLVRFYDVDVIGDYHAIMIGSDRGKLREGRRATISYLDICLLSPSDNILVSVEDVFLNQEGAIILERWNQGDDERFLGALVEMGPDGISLIRYFPGIDHVAEVLTVNASRVIPRTGMTVDIDASVESVDGFVASQRELASEELDVYPILDEEGNLDQAIAIVGSFEAPCRTALWWRIEDDQVLDEQRFVGVRTAATCDPVELGIGWWTGLSLPTPLDQRLSAEIEVGGETIGLFNSNDDRRALVEWAYGRFEIHGLVLPVVDRIVFEPSAPCGSFDGLARTTSEDTSIYVCVEDIVCRHTLCDGYSSSAKRAILHELAHIWMRQNLDATQQQQFMAATNTTTWNDEAVVWQERGVEWAAETIAWGLIDVRLHLVRLGFPPCELISDGFSTLTDLPPPWDCATDLDEQEH